MIVNMSDSYHKKNYIMKGTCTQSVAFLLATSDANDLAIDA